MMGYRFGRTAERWGRGLGGLLSDGVQVWEDCCETGQRLGRTAEKWGRVHTGFYQH